MWLRGRLLAPFLFCCCFVTGDNKFNNRNGKQIYRFLKHFQSQRVGEISTLQIPLLILPVIIVPSINHQEDVTTSKVIVEEYQEDDRSTKKQPTIKIESNLTESVDDDNDIEINFRQSLNRGTKVPKRDVSKIEPTVQQNIDVLNQSNDFSSNETNELNFTASITNSKKIEEKTMNGTLSATNQKNMYPASTYTNETEPLKFTIVTNDESTLPPNSDERWKNLTQLTNLFTFKENKTSLSQNSNSSVTKTNLNKGPYPAPMYNNTMIDQVSITANSYTNLESPPTQNDRWMSFSSLKRGSSRSAGFTPLSGLYYDGFLHSPLIKTPGFVPYKYYYR